MRQCRHGFGFTPARDLTRRFRPSVSESRTQAAGCFAAVGLSKCEPALRAQVKALLRVASRPEAARGKSRHRGDLASP